MAGMMESGDKMLGTRLGGERRQWHNMNSRADEIPEEEINQLRQKGAE